MFKLHVTFHKCCGHNFVFAVSTPVYHMISNASTPYIQSSLLIIAFRELEVISVSVGNVEILHVFT